MEQESIVPSEISPILKSQFSLYYSNKILDFVCKEIKNTCGIEARLSEIEETIDEYE